MCFVVPMRESIRLYWCARLAIFIAHFSKVCFHVEDGVFEKYALPVWCSTVHGVRYYTFLIDCRELDMSIRIRAGRISC